jgi:predicted secreted protein
MAETRHTRAGEPHVIVLPGLGAAGYQWAAQAPAGVRVERVEAAGPSGGAAAGQSVDAVFQVVADGPGVYAITFEHRRPWERDVAPVETREFELHVEA